MIICKLIGESFDRFTMKFIVFFISFMATFGVLAQESRITEATFPVRDNPMVDGTLMDKRTKLILPEEVVDYADLNVTEVAARNSDTKELQKIKYYIMNGEIRLARLYLDKLNYSQTKLKPIIYRYQGILNFIEGNFARSFEFFDKPELKVIPNYGKICLLKVLDRIVLSKKIGLQSEWDRCIIENARTLNLTNLAWLNTLVELKLRPVEGITSAPFKALKIQTLETPQLKILLKMGLYLNQESLLVPQFPTLEIDQLSDPEVRELMGHLSFRQGELAKAYKFIEGISTPNTENIRGNLYLLRQKYELAYAQFKLALEIKQNSQNALERLLPLAWMMKDWQRGLEYAERVVASPQTQVGKLTIVAAFLLQNERYDEAREILNVITSRSRFGYHLDAAEINAYVALVQNSSEIARKNARASCEQYDMMYCWVVMQMDTWDSFPLTLRRKDKIAHLSEWEKLTVEEINDPLKETVYVNQLDIEELDDGLIKLSPKATP